jgi:hypothetical protein
MKTRAYTRVAGILLATLGTGLGQPVITQQPQSCTNLAGTTVTFAVKAKGPGQLTYQWQNSTGGSWMELAGCTGPSLCLTNVGLAQAADYRVVVRDTIGETTSEVACLVVLFPPRITLQPTNWPAAFVGAWLNNRVVAGGTAPLSYQWRLNGEPLPGQTKSSIILANLKVADGGNYDVVITNVAGSTTSSVVTLTVNPAQFQNVTAAAGLVNENGNCIGAAWGDYDNDGFIDLYFAVGADAPHANSLYHNNRNGTFTRMSGAKVGPIVKDVHDSFGCAWIDFNNDGNTDMLVINGGWGPSRNDVYMNKGDGTFRSVSAGSLTDSNSVNMSCVACADYDGDGLVDIYLAQGSSTSGPWQPRLYHATSSGVFTPSDLGPANGGVNDAVWGDYNNDGKPDLFTCNFGSPNYLWRNDGQGKFTSMTNGFPLKEAVAHAAWGDYDNDGNLDIALFATNGTSLYRNGGQGNFLLVTNLGAAWIGVPAWADYDNDGYLDLLLINGTTGQSVYLYRNNGDGTFTSMSDPLTASVGGWWCGSWGDCDNDGFMDVVLVESSGQNQLYRNLGNTNHWIKFKLIGTASNRDAIGAKVHVLATMGGKSFWQMQEINGGYLLQNDLRPNFGLGDATTVDLVRVEWPSGNVQQFAGLTVNKVVTLTESTAITPARPSACLNGSVTLTRTAVGGTYQWQFEGADLIGQTNRTLNLNNLTAAQQGHYSVVASNAVAIVTNFVYLFVDTTFTKITTGPIATDLANTWTASWGDYDNDGYADLFVARYGVGPSVVYHNNRDGTFSTVTTLLPATPDKWMSGFWADFDNDGQVDLFAARDSNPALFCFNNGDGTFAKQQFDSMSPWSISAVDYDRDGLLDLYVSGATNRLYQDLGGRNFRNMSFSQVGPIASASSAGLAWADYDDDGWPDVVCASGMLATRMFHNDGTGHFVSVSNAVTLQTGALAEAWGDYDNDGRLDLALATGATNSVLYHNLGNGQFVKAAVGVTLPYANSASWADYDNDGFLDLFLTTGGLGYTNALYHNNGDGTFTAVTTGTLVTESAIRGSGLYTASYSGLWFDYDNDGFLDLFVSNGDDAGTASTRNFLYHNNGNSNAWLVVKPVGTASNRSGIGAKVKVLATYAGKSRWQRRDISTGDFYNGNNLYAFFGLGNATNVTALIIEWPSGTKDMLLNVAPRQYVTIVEPSLQGALAKDGRFHLSMTMSTNRVYQLQGSSDLVTWTTLTNCTGNASSAPIEFVDPDAPSMRTARFYRMR